MSEAPSRERLNPEGGRQIDLREIVDIWYRRRLMIVSLIVLSLLVTEFANYVVYPIYESQVKLLIEGPAGFDVPFSRENIVFKKSEITQTQSEILTSDPNLKEVVRALALDERPVPSEGLRDRIHGLARGVMDALRGLKQGVKRLMVETLGGTYKPPRKPSKFELAVNHLRQRSNLMVEPMPNTDVLLLTVHDRDAELAAAVANQITQVFTRNELAARIGQARNIHDSIEKRIDAVGPIFEAARDAVAVFKNKHGIADIDGQVDAALEKLALLELTFWDLSQKESVRELSTWEAYQREAMAVRELSARERNALIDKISELAELETTYQPDHPKVLAARASIDEVIRELRKDYPQAAPNAPNAPNTDTETLKNSLRAEIDETRAELNRLSDLDTRYQTLVWDQEHRGEVYKFLIRKREDASIAEYTTQTRVRIVEPAEANFDPVKPRKWLNRGLALLASLAVAIGLSAFLEYVDRTIRNPEGVARAVGLPTLGSIPYVSR